ncbi:hypothetical protein GCM10027418_04700 [Mariniluteicoccus endophyticus]
MAIDPSKPLMNHETQVGTFVRADTGQVLLTVHLRETPRKGDTITFGGVPWRIEHVHWTPNYQERFKAIQFHVEIRCVPDLR